MFNKKYNKYVKNNDGTVTIFVNYKDKQLEVKIDENNLEKVIKVGSWHAIYDKTLQTPSYYIAHRYHNKIKGKGVLKLHRFIMNCPRNKIVDHINHNTLDNRKCNLKICTHFENQQNLRSKKTEQTGVYQRQNKKWVANISKNKIRYYKEFSSKIEAIKWRKEQELILYKEVVSKW